MSHHHNHKGYQLSELYLVCVKCYYVILKRFIHHFISLSVLIAHVLSTTYLISSSLILLVSIN